MTDVVAPDARPLNARIFAKAEHGWYIERPWCIERLLDVERFAEDSTIIDPHCGWGTIPKAAMARGYHVLASDIVDRGAAERVPGLIFHKADFYEPDLSPHFAMHEVGPVSVITNPPFDHVEATVRTALRIATDRVCVIVQWGTIPAALWLQTTPLARVWPMNPRPSMPPGEYIAAGGEIGGGKQDFAWLVFEHGYAGEPPLRWLNRERRG